MTKTSMSGAGEFYHHYPRIAAVITAQADGKKNAMAAAWHSPISHTPPIIGVSLSPKRFTHKLILQSGEFAINFLPMEKVDLIVGEGSVSGTETDKFKKLGIATDESTETSAPILKDAYAAYECKLIDSQEYGDHYWIVGEIAATHFDKALFTAEETIDLRRVSPVLYLGADMYTIPTSANSRIIERKK